MSLQYRLPYKKVFKFMKYKTLHRYCSRAMVKRPILQLYRTTISLSQLQMAASKHFFKKCDQTIRQVKIQIPKKNSRNQPSRHATSFQRRYDVVSTQKRRRVYNEGVVKMAALFFQWLLVFYLASSKSRTHDSIALKYAAIKLE